jgi:hypothetical protein
MFNELKIGFRPTGALILQLADTIDLYGQSVGKRVRSLNQSPETQRRHWELAPVQRRSRDGTL